MSMPAIFLGHGSPMNAIEANEFAPAWRALGESLPPPKAILCISAHWYTRGSGVTAMTNPRVGWVLNTPDTFGWSMTRLSVLPLRWSSR